jgi:hypothetical protein
MSMKSWNKFQGRQASFKFVTEELVGHSQLEGKELVNWLYLEHATLYKRGKCPCAKLLQSIQSNLCIVLYDLRA